MKKISKFDYWYLSLCTDYWHFAVFNAQRYTIEEVKAAVRNTEGPDVVFGDLEGEFQIDKVFVKWSAGKNEDGEQSIGWVEYFKRSFENLVRSLSSLMSYETIIMALFLKTWGKLQWVFLV